MYGRWLCADRGSAEHLSQEAQLEQYHPDKEEGGTSPPTPFVCIYIYILYIYIYICIYVWPMVVCGPRKRSICRRRRSSNSTCRRRRAVLAPSPTTFILQIFAVFGASSYLDGNWSSFVTEYVTTDGWVGVRGFSRRWRMRTNTCQASSTMLPIWPRDTEESFYLESLYLESFYLESFYVYHDSATLGEKSQNSARFAESQIADLRGYCAEAPNLCRFGESALKLSQFKF